VDLVEGLGKGQFEDVDVLAVAGQPAAAAGAVGGAYGVV